MSHLTDISGNTVALSSHHTVGRHPDNALVLTSTQVSSQHAVLRWRGTGWVVRDLGSTNGTQLNGRELKGGIDALLRKGDKLQFANGDTFTLDSVEGPEPMALPIGGGTPCVGTGQVVAIPDAEAPVVCVLPTVLGWTLEGPDGVSAVRDGQHIDVNGQAWVLRLPRMVQHTSEYTHKAARLGLRFEVSRDEEHVRLEVRLHGATHPLKSRVHHYTLLILARRRLEDRATGLPQAEEGWIAQEDLERMLRLERNVLYQHIYRARRELAALGVPATDEIVERRHDAGQLRLGIWDTEVESIASGS